MAISGRDFINALISTTLAAALAFGGASPVRAEIVYFWCRGTLETYNDKSQLIQREPWSESLTFDSDKKTIKLAERDPLPAQVNNDSLVMPWSAPRRSELGTFETLYLMLDRISGRLEVRSRNLKDTTQVFFATCDGASAAEPHSGQQGQQ
jgi:hypothetical protein